MEIRKVEKSVANYPRKNEVEKSEIKKATPKKWLFSGMLLSIFNLVVGRVFASEISRNPPVIAGGFQVVDPTGMIVGAFVTIIEPISFVLFILGIVSIVYIKISAKRKNEEYKVSRKQKIFTIIPVVVLVLCFITRILMNIFQDYDIA